MQSLPQDQRAILQFTMPSVQVTHKLIRKMTDKASFQKGSGKVTRLTVFRSTITKPISKQGTAYTSRSVSRGSNGHGVLSLVNGKSDRLFGTEESSAFPRLETISPII
jgi:hypothetical protein